MNRNMKTLHKIIQQSEPPSQETLYRRLLTSECVCQLSHDQLLSLIEECRQHLDPDFFLWLKRNQIKCLSPRGIIFCILIRLHKGSDEIKHILGLGMPLTAHSKAASPTCCKFKKCRKPLSRNSCGRSLKRSKKKG